MKMKTWIAQNPFLQVQIYLHIIPIWTISHHPGFYVKIFSFHAKNGFNKFSIKNPEQCEIIRAGTWIIFHYPETLENHKSALHHI